MYIIVSNPIFTRREGIMLNDKSKIPATKDQERPCHSHSPTTSTISPSSKSASPISESLANLSPSTLSCGIFCATAPPVPFDPEGAVGWSLKAAGYCSARPALFKNALTMAPQVVVDLTATEMSFPAVTLERRMILNVSSACGSASDSCCWLDCSVGALSSKPGWGWYESSSEKSSRSSSSWKLGLARL